MQGTKSWLSILLIGTFIMSPVFLHSSLGPALAQVKQSGTLSTLKNIFAPRRRQGATRGSVCLIVPGLKPEGAALSDVPLILNDRPLFIWQQPVTRVEVRQTGNYQTLWNQTVLPRSNQVSYQGAPLQPGQIYQIIAFNSNNQPLNNGEDAQFALVSPNRRTQINAVLAKLEAKLRQQNASEEEIAIEKAIFLTKQSLLSDSFQLLYSLPDRSSQLNSFISDITTLVCD